MSFRLTDGTRLRGELFALDEEGIDGSFGRRRWEELHLDDVWGLHRRVMNADDAAQWLALGARLLMIVDPSTDRDGRELAERAFRHALRLDPSVEEQIEALRAERAEADARRAELARAAEAERLTTQTPEAADYPDTPWPPLSAEQRTEAQQAVRADALAKLDAVGLAVPPIEADHILMLAQAEPEKAARWTLLLEDAHKRLVQLLDIPPERDDVFHGRAVVFVFENHDRLRLFAAETFNHFVRPSVHGRCFFEGPHVYVCVHRGRQSHEVETMLLRQFTHGFLHRHRRPTRLPTWANEGLADYIAATIAERSRVDSILRPKAHTFIRNGGNVAAALDLTYLDGVWPGPEEVGTAIGYLFARLLIEENPQAFAAWVAAVKDGAEWKSALAEHFGRPYGEVVSLFTQFYTTND